MRKLSYYSGGGLYSDPLELWERVMADISNKLMIKYGLRPGGPSSALTEIWVRRVRENIASGMNREAAGEAAARAVFTDFRTHVYASQADTIEMLLQEAGKR